MNRFDLLTADEQADYFQNAVGVNSTDPAGKIRRLSLVPGGRAFLLRELNTADRPGCHADILTVLGHRAAATRRSKRWDFMSEDECSRVESALGAAFEVGAQ